MTLPVEIAAKSLSKVLHAYCDRLEYIKVGRDLFNYILTYGLPRVMTIRENARKIIAYTYPKVELILDDTKLDSNRYEMIFRDQMCDADIRKTKKRLETLPYPEGTNVIIHQDTQKLKKKMTTFVGETGLILAHIGYENSYVIKLDSTGETVVIPQANVRELRYKLRKETSKKILYAEGTQVGTRISSLSSDQELDEESIKAILKSDPSIKYVTITTRYSLE